MQPFYEHFPANLMKPYLGTAKKGFYGKLSKKAQVDNDPFCFKRIIFKCSDILLTDAFYAYRNFYCHISPYYLIPYYS